MLKELDMLINLLSSKKLYKTAKTVQNLKGNLAKNKKLTTRDQIILAQCKFVVNVI